MGRATSQTVAGRALQRGADGAIRSAIGLRRAQSSRNRQSAILLLLAVLAGCQAQPHVLPFEKQTPIDRSLITCPAGFVVQPFVRDLTAPTAMAWDAEGSLLVAEGGSYSDEPRIVGFKQDGSRFVVYPQGRHFPFDIGRKIFRLYGPIGGMLVYKGLIYVSHRDEDGFGQITALDYKGGHRTIVAHLPAQGDFSVTDLAIDPRFDRLYFGVGAVTNSGVVGLDNWEWVRDDPKVRDVPWPRLHLRGYRFDSYNPFSGIFGPADKAVTGPFQAFNNANETEIEGSRFPSAAIYSCSPEGGDARVEAHGVRCPRGIAFNGSYFYFTNDGMTLRGTRPVRNDPDALLRLLPGQPWYGWPDYTTDLQPVWQDPYQPGPDVDISATGYKRVLFVIDREATNLDPKNQSIELQVPDAHTMVKGVFSPLSGAAKLDFVPSSWPLQYRNKAVVALSGDRAPFDTSGRPLVGPIGYKVVIVDTDRVQVSDFIRNTAGGPRSRIDPDNLNLIERPVDVKFGPDHTLYILDAGHMQIRDGREQYDAGSGQIFRLVPQGKPVMYHD